MSSFQWSVLVLLIVLVMLAVLAICIGIQARGYARDAKDEAEHERLLVRGTHVTPEQVQLAVEQVLHATGVLRALRPTGLPAEIASGNDYPRYNNEHSPAATPTNTGSHAPYPMPAAQHPLNGYREIGGTYGQTDYPAYEQRGYNGRRPQLVGANHGTTTAYPEETGYVAGTEREVLGTHPATDTPASMPSISDTRLTDPHADVEAIKEDWRKTAETTQDWSIAWNHPSGEQGYTPDQSETP